jgi:hypothetical protein
VLTDKQVACLDGVVKAWEAVRMIITMAMFRSRNMISFRKKNTTIFTDTRMLLIPISSFWLRRVSTGTSSELAVGKAFGGAGTIL